MLVLSSVKIDKYEYLIEKEILRPQQQRLKQLRLINMSI